MKTHEAFMQLAINSAQEGIHQNKGGPFGACITKDGAVIAIAHNTVLKHQDPTCHAEINAIRQAAQSLGNYDLSGCVIYTTAEPCPMCLGAIYWARLHKIHIGVPRDVAAQYGFDDAHFYQEINQPTENRSIPCETGLLAEQSEAVFQEWQKLARKLY
jgi:tRNA(Arg) A34 adenosine deaminase TadA